MTRLTGTVIVPLESSIGELMPQEHGECSLELWPSVLSDIERLHEAQHTVVLLLPDSSGLAEGQRPLGVPQGVELAFGAIGEAAPAPGLASRPGGRSGKTVFVSADRQARSAARQQLSALPVPHLQAVGWLLAGAEPAFARIFTRQRPDVRNEGLLPYSIERVADGWLTFGLATEHCLLKLARTGASFDLLALPYPTADCAFLRIDKARELTRLRWPGVSLLCCMDDRLVLAFDGPGNIELKPAPRQHGSLELLLPSPELLVEPVDPEAFTRQAIRGGAALAEGPHALAEASAAEPASAALALALPDSATFHTDCRRYSGQQPLSAGITIVSRHIRHVDNARAVSALVSELTALGYCTSTHGFAHGGVTLNNVIADLPGRGFFRIKPEVLKKIVAVLAKFPPRTPWLEIERALVHELGRPTVNRLLAAAGGPQRARVEAVAGIHRWLPCWRKPGVLIGIGAQLVVLGCHLDSAADRTSGYVPATDPAPGMDDNASGIAACLAAARYLAGFRDQLVHTVRLCFFNAEEAGLVGSKAYAAHLKATGAPVKAVLCADMLGYNSDAFRLFEIHAGFTDPAVRDRSLAAASLVQSWAATLGGLLPAQLYKGTSASVGAPDRELYDPAINRSDHAAFHQQGYGAALVSEDYFGNLASEPAKDPNPHYHSAGDLTVDADYGATIAAALACTMKDLAD